MKVNGIVRAVYQWPARPFGERQMAWVFLQVLLAFGVAIFIVWWTFPKNDDAPEKETDKPSEPPEIPPS
jgi:hypothetical protein